MEQSVSERIILGPGGSIPDIPENRELLELIEKTPKLPPEQLLELAIFYQVYPTNAFLAEHLALVAVTEAACIAGGLPDPIEDALCGYDSTREENAEKRQQARTFLVYEGDAYKGERHSKIAVARAHYEIKCIPSLVFGLGLLVETRHGRDPHVIGVCPEQMPTS
jgi:hypothetical protein